MIFSWINLKFFIISALKLILIYLIENSLGAFDTFAKDLIFIDCLSLQIQIIGTLESLIT